MRAPISLPLLVFLSSSLHLCPVKIGQMRLIKEISRGQTSDPGRFLTMILGSGAFVFFLLCSFRCLRTSSKIFFNAAWVSRYSGRYLLGPSFLHHGPSTPRREMVQEPRVRSVISDMTSCSNMSELRSSSRPPTPSETKTFTVIVSRFLFRTAGVEVTGSFLLAGVEVGMGSRRPRASAVPNEMLSLFALIDCKFSSLDG